MRLFPLLSLMPRWWVRVKPALSLTSRCFNRLYRDGDSRRATNTKSGSEQKPQRPPGGGRFLVDPARVYDFNNWDNVVWDEEQEAEAKRQVEKNSKTPVSTEDQEKYEEKSDVFWDEFYMQHKNRFFKDRHWLFTEFPELAPKGVPDHIPERVRDTGPAARSTTGEDDTSSQSPSEEGKGTIEPERTTEKDTVSEEKQVEESDHGAAARQEGTESFPGEHATTRFLEVGCGVGNTVFPVLQTNNDPNLFVYCCDLSATAIQLVKDHKDYSPARCHAFVYDVSETDANFPCPEGSLDLVILIFVLSAIHPDKMQRTIARLTTLLKPGGRIMFRDYARYDLAQLRFKDGKCLQENFYVRGDGTRVYFFTQEDLRSLFAGCGLIEEQNLIDRRLQVNRGRQLKMYRVWVQCKYRKPLQ